MKAFYFFFQHIVRHDTYCPLRQILHHIYAPSCTTNIFPYDKGDVCFFTLLHYPLWRPHFFFYPNDLLTQFSILPWQEIKKKKNFFLKIFIIFSRIFKKIFVFSRFFPYKMGNYQRIFDFSIGEALYRSLPYILKKSWKNI